MNDDYDTQEAYDLSQPRTLDDWLARHVRELSGFPLPAGRNGIGGAGIARKRPPRYLKGA